MQKDYKIGDIIILREENDVIDGLSMTIFVDEIAFLKLRTISWEASEYYESDIAQNCYDKNDWIIVNTYLDMGS